MAASAAAPSPWAAPTAAPAAPAAPAALPPAAQDTVMQDAAPAAQPVQRESKEPTIILRLANMVTRKDLLDDEEYEDIKDDSYWEIQDKYGGVVSLEIPRPAQTLALDEPGVGLVFVVFSATDNAVKAQAGLNGRKFGDNRVHASFYQLALYERRDLA